MRKKSKKEYIEIFNKKHNNKYDYSLMNYINNSIKIKIICPNHGIFEQRPNDHRNSGCPKCQKIQLSDFIKNSNIIHNNKFDYSLIKNIKNNKQKVKIICNEHGIFEQRVDNHINGIGCKKCTYKSYYIGVKKFIINSNNIHRNKYDYSLVYKNYVDQHSKVKIICDKHGIFEQIASNHTSGNGCPKCKETSGEKSIRYYLEDNNIEYIYQKIFKDCKYKKYLLYDFYLPDLNMCIEYDGEQHFKPIEYFGGINTFNNVKIKDKIKNEYCNNNNIHLIRISYEEDIEKKLDKKLNFS